MPEKIKVLIVEDDPDFIYLVTKMISQDSRLEFLGSAANKTEGVKLAAKLRPDIVLMDINLSENERDGIDAAKEIRVTTNAKIILLTSFEQPDVVIDASKKSFAAGYVYKSGCKGLANIIYETAVSVTPQEQFIRTLILQDLSPAEKSVLNMLVNGGFVLRSANKTILNQRRKIVVKLGLKNTDELKRLFGGWVD